MTDTAFEAASVAAWNWLNTVALVAHLGECGQVAEAYMLLMPAPDSPCPYNLQDSYYEHSPALEQARAALAGVSDGPVSWEHGRGWSAIARVPAAVLPHRWSSAHEAAAGIAQMALAMLAWPLTEITDPAEQWSLAEELLAHRACALAIPLEEQADLQERIYRERARLLQVRVARRRSGRPRKGESDKERLVIDALVTHHKCQPDGSVGNYTPATTEDLARMASGRGVTVSKSTVSRLFKKKFGERKYKGYIAACNRDAKVNIGMYLSLWQGELGKRLAGLLPHETGSEED